MRNILSTGAECKVEKLRKDDTRQDIIKMHLESLLDKNVKHLTAYGRDET
jgi:hypothetical protein